MKEQNRVGELPEDYLVYVASIRNDEEGSEDLLEKLKKWAGDNPYRQNQLAADLEGPLLSSQPSGSGTQPITPSSQGTGLPEQVKMPRDLRDG